MEFSQLSQKDYIKILKFYKLPVHKNKNTRKKTVEKKLAEKLCKCIKKLKRKSDKNESRATGICKNSVINKKGYSSFSFSCKKIPMLRKKKGKTYKLLKRIKTKLTKKK
tara:strand:- start:88 stop:414 length:327 start_codon:yes stop_codon:yes gene_type:complete